MSSSSESPRSNQPLAHTPYVPADQSPHELTWSAVVVGAVLGIIFGASSLYLVLRVGLTVSASIPIAVLSITLFRVFSRLWPFKLLFRRDATILENNIVQTTGSAGESIAFGVGVTMPAIMILGHDLEMVRVMLVAVLGGLLGILMMIPLRRAFIVRQHGKLAYPEGTACADVLIVGEKGGSSAATVFGGFGLALLYNFVMEALRFWKKEPERLLDTVAGRPFFKGASVAGELTPQLVGVGYVIGTRTSCIMVAGGVLAYWVLIPLIKLIGDGMTTPVYPAEKLIRDMSLGQLRNNYVLYIGAGAVATGGIISMFRTLPVILASIVAGFRDVAGGRAAPAGHDVAPRAGVPRTERDLSMRVVLLGTLGLILAIWAAPMLHMNWLGAAMIVLFGFLFVTVSSRLTGEIGSSSNPISGMTVATLLMTCLIFLLMGRTSPLDKLTALSVAGIVCVAASNGGGTSQDLKTGFLVGGTPRSQQLAILVGALTSALVIGAMLLLLNSGATIYSRKDLPTAKVDAALLSGSERPAGPAASGDTKSYRVLQAAAGQIAGVPAGKYLVDDAGSICYYVDPGINGRLKQQDDGTPVEKFDAPKATLMALIIDGILSQKLPWALVLLGVSIALVLELAGIPSLPFAVGVYLPLAASTPIFIGGMIRWLVERRRGPVSAQESEMTPGVLLSSGFIAGGSIASMAAGILPIWPDWQKWFDRSAWFDGWFTANVWSRLPAGVGEFFGQPSSSDAFALLPFALLCLVLLLVGTRRSRALAPASTAAG